MIQKELEVLTRAGIHARPASVISTIAQKYPCSVTIVKDSMTINAKSIMGIITLGAIYRTKLTLITEGEGEEECADEMEKAFLNRFDVQ